MSYQAPTVSLAVFDKPVALVCEGCESILARGVYAICVHINDVSRMLCVDDARVCCGISHTIWRLSSDRSWMQFVKRTVITQIEEGRIGSLKLDRDLMSEVCDISE